MPSEIKLYNMDCMEAMKEMPDKAFALAIVDPPYGIGDFNMQTSIGNIRGDRKHGSVKWKLAK
jgi:site-specific DNA-methyltransferase (adenine-specific)